MKEMQTLIDYINEQGIDIASFEEWNSQDGEVEEYDEEE